MKRGVLAAVVAVALATGVGAVAYAGVAGEDVCSPEAREAATSRDVDLMLSGVISLSEAYDREAERIVACE